MRKILPYHLGLIIPSAIILVNGLTTYFSVIIFDPNFNRQAFLVVYALVWLFYASAVLVNPGYTDGTKVEGGVYTDCLKCLKPKPERAHHCRVCKRCVLMMDHHCPWTENCVGHKNFGHFFRFLVTAAGLNAYGAYRCGSFLVYIYHNRRFRHRILPNNTRLWLGGLGMFLDAFITLTVGVLLLRVISDSSNGQTQIENWEQERVESLHRKRLAPRTAFPFDVGLRSNLETFFGQFPLDWVLPWGSARGAGHVFPKLFTTTERWPPQDNTEVKNHGYYRADRWINFEGETLHDFGVDQEAEYNPNTTDHHSTSINGTAGLIDRSKR